MLFRVGGNEYPPEDTDDLSFNMLRAAGYHFMGRKGMVIRASPMYILNTEKGDTFGNNFWFGLSLGYSF